MDLKERVRRDLDPSRPTNSPPSWLERQARFLIVRQFQLLQHQEEAVRSLVATGAGIALLPDLVYRPWSLEGDRIESRDVSGSLPVVQVGMAWRKGSPLSPAARDFIAIAKGHQAMRDR